MAVGLVLCLCNYCSCWFVVVVFVVHFYFIFAVVIAGGRFPDKIQSNVQINASNFEVEICLDNDAAGVNNLVLWSLKWRQRENHKTDRQRQTDKQSDRQTDRDSQVDRKIDVKGLRVVGAG